MNELIFAKVSTTFEDLHQYKKAPEEVAFLRNLHRHIFHVTIYIQQFHDDRDIEFIMFKRWLDKAIQRKIVKMNSAKSCEMMARELNKLIKRKYGKRKIRIEISEDGENGAYIEF